MTRFPKILNREYATFRPDIIDFFVNEVFPKTKALLDPMAGTSPLIPFVEYYGIKANFNDILPLHFYINRAKTYRVYKAITLKYKNNIDLVKKDIKNILSPLKGKKLIISSNWMHDDLLRRLIAAWDKTNNYDEPFSIFLKAVIILSVRFFGSYSVSYKNTTWYKPGGMSTDKSINQVVNEIVDSFFSYYNFYYRDIKKITRGQIRFYTQDASNIKIKQKIDTILTSPSFPNRYDYVQMYSPELYFLSFVDNSYNMDLLRKNILASNIVKDYQDVGPDLQLLKRDSPKTATFLLEIERIQIEREKKQKKRENNYYLRYFTKYYLTLYRTINKLLQLVSDDATLYLVLQNNIHRGTLNDLVNFVDEYCYLKGFKVEKVFQEMRGHQGRRNISADYPLVLKKHLESILMVSK